MKQYLHASDYLLWLAVILLQGLVAWFTVRRRLFRELPAFTIFICFVAIKSAALLLSSQVFAYRVYFWSYYAGIAVEITILFLVVYEVFAGSFNPLESLPAHTMARLIAVAAFGTALAFSWGLWTPASRPGFPKYVDFLNTLDRTSGVIVACLLWTIVMYARHLGIPWRSRLAGIAQGFLLNLTTQAIVIAGIGLTKPALGQWLSRVGMAAYIATLAIWFRALRQQEAAVTLPAPATLQKLHAVVAQMRTETGRLQVASNTRLTEE